MKITVCGINNSDKAKILDELEEYFEFTNTNVSINYENDIDTIVFAKLQANDEYLPEDLRFLYAHLAIATEGFFLNPEGLIFYFPVDDLDDSESLYEQVFDSLSLADLVVRLPYEPDEAADQVRSIVEGLTSDDSDAPSA